jgi:hypothetical protein
MKTDAVVFDAEISRYFDFPNGYVFLRQSGESLEQMTEKKQRKRANGRILRAGSKLHQSPCGDDMIKPGYFGIL